MGGDGNSRIKWGGRGEIGLREGKFGEGNSDTAQDFFLSDVYNLH